MAKTNCRNCYCSAAVLLTAFEQVLVLSLLLQPRLLVHIPLKQREVSTKRSRHHVMGLQDTCPTENPGEYLGCYAAVGPGCCCRVCPVPLLLLFISLRPWFASVPAPSSSKRPAAAAAAADDTAVSPLAYLYTLSGLAALCKKPGKPLVKTVFCRER